MVIGDVLMDNNRVESRTVTAEYLVSWVRDDEWSKDAASGKDCDLK